MARSAAGQAAMANKPERGIARIFSLSTTTHALAAPNTTPTTPNKHRCVHGHVSSPSCKMIKNVAQAQANITAHTVNSRAKVGS